MPTSQGVWLVGSGIQVRGVGSGIRDQGEGAGGIRESGEGAGGIRESGEGAGGIRESGEGGEAHIENFKSVAAKSVGTRQGIHKVSDQGTRQDVLNYFIRSRTTPPPPLGPGLA